MDWLFEVINSISDHSFLVLVLSSWTVVLHTEIWKTGEDSQNVAGEIKSSIVDR